MQSKVGPVVGASDGLRSRRKWLGILVLVAAGATLVVMGRVRSSADAVRAELLRPTDDPQVLAVRAAAHRLVTDPDNPPPQGFGRAVNSDEARALRSALVAADPGLEATWRYHRWDLAFMACYGALFGLCAWWARCVARPLIDAGGVGGRLGEVLWLAAPAGLLGVAGALADLVEYFACAAMLRDEAAIASGWLPAAGAAFVVKWLGVAAGSLLFFLTATVAVVHARWVRAAWGAMTRALGRITGRLFAARPVQAVVRFLGALAAGLGSIVGKTMDLVLAVGRPVAGGARWVGRILSLAVRGFLAILPRDRNVNWAGVVSALPDTWELIVKAWRFSMRARFSIIVGALFAVLLSTGPGLDVIRTLATGSWAATDAGKAAFDPARLGWFAAAVVLLSATCWGWSRLVLALKFGESDPTGADDGRQRDVVARLRRALPVYHGSVPLVAAAAAFAVAPLAEGGSEGTTASLFAAPLATLVIFLLVPFVVILLRMDSGEKRTRFGPLSWTLLIYVVLAVVHAGSHWDELRWLGLIPIVLLLLALVVFGLGRPAGIWLAPAALLAAAGLAQGGFPWWAFLALVALGSAASWAQAHLPSYDDPPPPVSLGRMEMLDGMRSKQVIHARLAKHPGLAGDAAAKITGLLRIGAALALFQAAVFVAVLAAPQAFPALAGSGAVLALGLGAWVTAGSVLVVWTQSVRFPLISVALALAVVFSLWMDNHGIRLIPGASAPVKQSRDAADASGGGSPIAEAFGQWRRQVRAAVAAGNAAERPCVIVATEGGGIRAAFWTATVLGTLQDASVRHGARGGRPDFASHLFGVSGISGGSVGAAFFAALCAEPGREARDMRGPLAMMLGRDHLAPAVAALLYPDFVQRFLPVALLPDRARALEQSWERAWREVPGTDRMAEPFMRVWSGLDGPWVPRVFLSGALVENGKRVIASPLAVTTGSGGEFVDAHDLHAHLRTIGPVAGKWQDVPLSTAAHTSARFPIVSPPGRLPSGWRVMDGGYFESSAASAGLDVLEAVHRASEAQGTPLIFIFLRYEEPGSEAGEAAPRARATKLVPARDEEPIQPGHLLNETVSLLGPLVKARGARGSYAIEAVHARYGNGRDPRVQILEFTFAGEQIPLSWALSRRSCAAILAQMPESAASAGADAPATADTNRERMGTLLHWLYPP